MHKRMCMCMGMGMCMQSNKYGITVIMMVTTSHSKAIKNWAYVQMVSISVTFQDAIKDFCKTATLLGVRRRGVPRKSCRVSFG